MNRTASLVMKIIGASLAFAAVVCLILGGWSDIRSGVSSMKGRIGRKLTPGEAADYADEDLYI